MNTIASSSVPVLASATEPQTATVPEPQILVIGGSPGRRDRKRDEETIRLLLELRRFTPLTDRDWAEQLFFFLADNNGYKPESYSELCTRARISPGKLDDLRELLDRYGLVRWDRERGYLIIDWEILATEVRRPMRQLADPKYRTRYLETEEYLK